MRYAYPKTPEEVKAHHAKVLAEIEADRELDFIEKISKAPKGSTHYYEQRYPSVVTYYVYFKLEDGQYYGRTNDRWVLCDYELLWAPIPEQYLKFVGLRARP